MGSAGDTPVVVMIVVPSRGGKWRVEVRGWGAAVLQGLEAHSSCRLYRLRRLDDGRLDTSN